MWFLDHVVLGEHLTNYITSRTTTLPTTYYLHYHKAYGQQTWEEGGLYWVSPIHEGTWPFGHVVLQDHVA